jgi:hypothetical protein
MLLIQMIMMASLTLSGITIRILTLRLVVANSSVWGGGSFVLSPHPTQPQFNFKLNERKTKW